MKYIRSLFLLLAAAIASSASAQLSIEITGAGANRIPIALVNYDGDKVLTQALNSVVRADLDRSGLLGAKLDSPF